MHPIVTVIPFGSRSIPIGSYGVMLCIAIAVAAFGTLRAAHRARLDIGACVAALGASVAGGFGGALLLHGLVQSMRLGSLREGLAQPGLAFFGALLGGAAALLFTAHRLGLPALELADRAVPPVVLAHALGRFGCLLGGCCFGRPWSGPLAVHYDDPLAPAAISSVGRHPVPLYEAALLLALFVLFSRRPLGDAGSGRRVLAYLASYSAMRVLLECLRGDSVRGVYFDGAVSTSQLIAVAVLLACAGLRLQVPSARSLRA